MDSAKVQYVKYLPHLKRVLTDGGIIFAVLDQGEGIKEQDAMYIFDKFYQADTSHKQEGNGLGLALVKNIMAGEMMRILDGPFGIADVTTENILCGFDNSHIADNLRRIRTTTPEELRALAQKYLDPKDMVTVVAGDFS